MICFEKMRVQLKLIFIMFIILVVQIINIKAVFFNFKFLITFKILVISSICLLIFFNEVVGSLALG